IVYVCGAFDLFHIGHLSFLEEAAKLGDYLIVGILNDQVINDYKGSNHPIMSLHERVLSVLAYKPVNEVVIGAPYCVTDDIIDRFNISFLFLVIESLGHSRHAHGCGANHLFIQVVCQGIRVPHHNHSGPDPFEAPKRRGIYREVDSKSDMTTEKIIERIIEHRHACEAPAQLAKDYYIGRVMTRDLGKCFFIYKYDE
ncbi:cytidyltransferase domain protein, partial [Ancylostoma duodenale]